MTCRSCLNAPAVEGQHLCLRCKAILSVRRVRTMARNRERRTQRPKGGK